MLVAWKAGLDDGELSAGAKAAAEVGLDPQAVVEVEPFEGVRDRNLVVYRKVAETPERFPRRAGVAAKRPLG